MNIVLVPERGLAVYARRAVDNHGKAGGHVNRCARWACRGVAGCVSLRHADVEIFFRLAIGRRSGVG